MCARDRKAGRRGRNGGSGGTEEWGGAIGGQQIKRSGAGNSKACPAVRQIRSSSTAGGSSGFERNSKEEGASRDWSIAHKGVRAWEDVWPLQRPTAHGLGPLIDKHTKTTGTTAPKEGGRCHLITAPPIFRRSLLAGWLACSPPHSPPAPRSHPAAGGALVQFCDEQSQLVKPTCKQLLIRVMLGYGLLRCEASSGVDGLSNRQQWGCRVWFTRHGSCCACCARCAQHSATRPLAVSASAGDSQRHQSSSAALIHTYQQEGLRQIG